MPDNQIPAPAQKPYVECTQLKDIAVTDGHLTICGRQVKSEPTVVHHTGPYFAPVILDFEAEKPCDDGNNQIFRLIAADDDCLGELFEKLSPSPVARGMLLQLECADGLAADVLRISRNLELLRNLRDCDSVTPDDKDRRLSPVLAASQRVFGEKLLKDTLELCRLTQQNARDRLLTDEPSGSVDFYSYRILCGELAVPVPASAERRFVVPDSPDFTVRCLMTETISDVWSPALFAAEHADGSFNILFTEKASSRLRLLGISPEDVGRYRDLRYPLADDLRGIQLSQALSFMERLRESTPPETEADEDKPCNEGPDRVAEAMCRWITDSTENWLSRALCELNRMRPADPIPEIPFP